MDCLIRIVLNAVRISQFRSQHTVGNVRPEPPEPRHRRGGGSQSTQAIVPDAFEPPVATPVPPVPAQLIASTTPTNRHDGSRCAGADRSLILRFSYQGM
jgi:hypothetical protein